jgi:anthranilate phosphoribosyltransferase
LTLTDRSRVSEGKAGRVSSYLLDPADFGVPRVRLKDLQGGTAEENAYITREILQGRLGPKRDVVCLNAAPAFIACGKAKSWREGYEMAAEVIESGAAYEKLERLIEFTNK